MEIHSKLLPKGYTALAYLFLAVMFLHFGGDRGVLAQQTPAVKYTDIWEHTLYEGLSQEAKSVRHYRIKVGQRFYTGTEHLAIKAIAEDFGSDPDVFISKTNSAPTSSQDSKWYCEGKGSELCMLHDGEFALDDVLYIGIRCLYACSYKLKALYLQVTDISESSRT
jgi:hypothetical protein